MPLWRSGRWAARALVAAPAYRPGMIAGCPREGESLVVIAALVLLVFVVAAVISYLTKPKD